MKSPPVRLILIALFLAASGISSIYKFTPRSEPAGLILPLIPDIAILAAGIGLLLRQEWARKISLVFCWILFVVFCVMAVIWMVWSPRTFTPLKAGLIGFAFLFGGALYWWMLRVLHSAGIRSWMKNEGRV